MKIVLMVAAGVAVGLTVALAVLVQIVAALVQTVVHLAPVLAVLAFAVLVLRLMRRRSSIRAAHAARGPRYPAVFPSTQVPARAAIPSAESNSVDELHLQWGPPPAAGDLEAAPVIISAGAGAHVRRARAGSRHSRAVRSRRP